jgi:hypothetical protein
MALFSISAKRRLKSERRMINAMIALYCREQHAGGRELCPDCVGLAMYANQRLDKCPYPEAEKPTCAQCPIHCYKPVCREQIRVVMRYAGPRMLTRRPVLAVRHLLHGRRPIPERPRRRPEGQRDRMATANPIPPGNAPGPGK